MSAIENDKSFGQLWKDIHDMAYDLKLPIVEYMTIQQVEFAYLDCIMHHFFTNELLKQIGRYPYGKTTEHLDAKYRKLAHLQHNSDVFESMNLFVFSGKKPSLHDLNIGIHKLTAYANKHYKKRRIRDKKIKSFITICLSILWYYLRVYAESLHHIKHM